ncbi:hypothetical protein PH505_cc00170 [Pseudoalteromonas distincta]|nr:hypothetical protein PH505_cc00170 [Pseudoalteromonas distincta]
MGNTYQNAYNLAILFDNSKWRDVTISSSTATLFAQHRCLFL